MQSPTAIAKALLQLLAGSDFYANPGITALEVGPAVIGGLAGLGVEIPLRANRFASRAYEAFVQRLRSAHPTRPT